MDVTTIEEALGRIEEGVAEARVATELLRDGDVTAISDLDGVVDAMVREIAELKTRTSPGST